MVFPVVGGNESKGYEISNSLRFNRGDNPKLEFTPSSVGNRRTFTFSFWIKRAANFGNTQYIFYTDNNGSGSTDFLFYLTDNNQFSVGFLSGSQKYLITNRVLRDPSAWYHIVVAVDTTQATASNRIKVYINGVQETSFGTDQRSDLSQDTQLDFSRQAVHRISGYNVNSSPLDAYLTEFHAIDGSAKAQTDFGEFDDNGVWIPKKYTGTYGTNGFFLEFQQTGTSANSSGIGADTSGNDHHFTPSNLAALDVTEDTCTNNFATLNPLINSSVTFSEGNTKATVGGTVPRVAASTFSVTSGKWYCEVKITATAAGATLFGVEADDFPQNATVYSNGDGVTYNTNGTATTDGSNASYGATYAADDIMGIALNLDDNEITFYKNGASQGAISKTFSGGYVFIGSHGSSSNSSGYNFNFGNPSFSISSGNNDGKYGNFEYAPPSGYYALCTKRLAEFG
jgi:hypothetical protein